MFGSGVIVVKTLPNHRVEPRATGDGHPSQLAPPIENRQTLGTKTPKRHPPSMDLTCPHVRISILCLVDY